MAAPVVAAAPFVSETIRPSARVEELALLQETRLLLAAAEA